MKLTTRDFRGAPSLHFAEGPPAGPTLLLLHGVTRCWRDWERMLPALTHEWRVIALDHRGHGGSGRAESYLVTDYVADAVRFVREEMAAPLVILGHSLGAMVAAAVAAEAPEFVREAVLVDPPFHTMGNRIAATAWQAQFTGTREVVRGGGTVTEMADALAEIRLPAPGGTFRRLGDLRDRAALLWGAECLARLDPEVLTPLIEGRWLDSYDVAAVLSRIRCPVFLLQADPAAGGVMTDADAEEVVQALLSCQRERFPGMGHQLHRDCPEAVLRVLRGWSQR